MARRRRPVAPETQNLTADEQKRLATLVDPGASDH
jgi:hypothetical protein